MKAPLRALPVLLSLLATASAHACTVCNSGTGRALRSALFNGTFLHTFLLVMAPAPVLIVAVAILHLAMPDLPLAKPDSVQTACLACEAAA